MNTILLKKKKLEKMELLLTFFCYVQQMWVIAEEIKNLKTHKNQEEKEKKNKKVCRRFPKIKIK